MATEERLIAFDPAVLQELERRGADLSATVNAVMRAEFGRGAGMEELAGAPAEAYSAAFLQALLDRDAPRARAAVEAAVAASFPLADVYAEVIGPALHEVGHLWAIERISVAQEHFATALTHALLPTLAPAARRPAPAAGRLAIVSGTPGELHVLGALMVADLLEREGWEVLSLGADTPADDLIELVESECPDLVALSTSTAGRMPGFADVLRRLDAVRPRPVLVAGGGLFGGTAAEEARSLGADLVLTDVRELIPALRAFAQDASTA
jgi:MerR family transcriptional regulator, light-induced transcriptional regulator